MDRDSFDTQEVELLKLLVHSYHEGQVGFSPPTRPESRENGFRETSLAALQPYMWRWKDDEQPGRSVPDDFAAAATRLEEKGYLVRSSHEVLMSLPATNPTQVRLIRPTNKGLARVEYLDAGWGRKVKRRMW